MTAATRKRLRAIIRRARWKKATSAEFKNAPHSYIIAMKSGPEWRYFANAIRKHGVYRSWHRKRFKYLVIDGYCYWTCFPALNRARSDTLD
jgi:hypothetical protein